MRVLYVQYTNPGGYPPAFVEHYPALKGMVETASDGKAGLFEDEPVPAAKRKTRGATAARSAKST